MKKKGYKQMQRKMLREMSGYVQQVQHEIRQRILAEGKAELAQREAENYRKRIREIGMNMEIIDPGTGTVKCVEWTMNPQAWGNYVMLTPDMDEIPQEALDDVKDELARSAVESAARNELIQYIIKGKNEMDPLHQFTTIAGKIYIVPWEQMPHKETIKLRQLIDDALAEEEKP